MTCQISDCVKCKRLNVEYAQAERKAKAKRAENDEAAEARHKAWVALQKHWLNRKETG